MAEVEITTTVSATSQYTILYSLLKDGTSIASVTIEKDKDFASAATRISGEIPNLTWVDTVIDALSHTYSIEVTVSGTGIVSPSVAITRALNII
nr:hypothetical protein [Clostridium estertheticum]